MPHIAALEDVLGHERGRGTQLVDFFSEGAEPKYIRTGARVFSIESQRRQKCTENPGNKTNYFQLLK